MATLAKVLGPSQPDFGPTVSTTDATGTVVARYVIRDRGAYMVTAKVVAVRTSDYAQAATYWREALALWNNAGLLSLVPALTYRTVVTDNESDATWDVTISVGDEDVDGDGTTEKVLLVNVFGKAATNIAWRAQVEVIKII